MSTARQALAKIPVRVVAVKPPQERKPWGTIARWARHRLREHRTTLQSQTERRYIDESDAKVPCDGCNACCRSGLEIDLEPWEPAEKFDLESRTDGVKRLRKNADGSCVHLVDGKCSIYAHRPLACRTYDCRDLALVLSCHGSRDGMQEPVNRVIASWEPEFKSLEDRIVYVALGYVAMMQFSKGEEVPTTAALVALRDYSRYMELARQMVAKADSDREGFLKRHEAMMRKLPTT